MQEAQAKRPADGAPDDEGLFGPKSVTWQLHADPIMWIAGVRALYLQALHPRTLRGVVQNSNFREDPWGRLFRTAAFVGTTTYGTRAEAEQFGARVRRIHRSLKAVDPETGESYRIDEPELLRWVHCAEVASYAEVIRRAGFPLTEDQVDTYYREQQASAVLVGLAPEDVPASREAMRVYFDEVRPELGRSAEADDVWDFLRRPPVHPALWLGRELIWRQFAELAYGSLPSWAHDMYGHRPLPPVAVTLGLHGWRTSASVVLPLVRPVFQSPHIKAAVERLGPEAAPSASRLAA
ncbi:MAG TPA: oxygenase MpaB family protein [Yinghuangia sp.]|uniref:oxygenase MpaB family protein n=1 Tax=Yinghuangia sp. YIM S10712 TaxID=3436930 RepID=UPI002BD3C257|nr:oxygenase MpaB family protein [Yinghuangia sp.]